MDIPVFPGLESRLIGQVVSWLPEVEGFIAISNVIVECAEKMRL